MDIGYFQPSHKIVLYLFDAFRILFFCLQMDFTDCWPVVLPVLQRPLGRDTAAKT